MEQLQVESERRAKEYDKLKATMQKLEKENYALREQNAEMEEEYVRSARELADLRKLENDFKCRTWLQGAEGGLVALMVCMPLENINKKQAASKDGGWTERDRQRAQIQ